MEQNSPDMDRTALEDKEKTLVADYNNLRMLTVSSPADLPRGVPCRVALRVEGGVAANHVSMMVGMAEGCLGANRLAALMSEHASSG